VDTAGRQVIDADLMGELQRMKTVSQAQETLLIVDAMTGQEAASLTAAFDAAVGLTGAILTKMDGDSRGGAAVSVRGVSGKPIKFVGTGEKTADLEPFFPDRMASRILGMGDVVSLVEKAAAEVSDADAMKMQQKMMDASFDFDDFLKQSELLTKMGSVAGIAKLMPGMGGQLDNNQIRDVEARLKKNKSLICSMTKKERMNPDLLVKDASARSRLQRITKGAGLKLDVGQQFMSEFQRMRTMMARMQKQQMGGQMDPSAALGPGADEGMPMMGNRAMRRSSKKKKSAGRGGGGGFG
jgi:signal recognition particle subunit SRP54